MTEATLVISKEIKVSSIDGETIAACFSLVSAVGNELCGLETALNNMITAQLTDRSQKKLDFVLESIPITNDRLDDGQWVFADQAVNFLVIDRDKRKTSVQRYFGYQISMMGSGIAIPGNLQPLVHIFCWSTPVNFDNNNFIEFPFGTEVPFKVIEDRLMYWVGTSLSHPDHRRWSNCEWCFSLRLTSLNSEDDLRKYAIAPAMALLSGENILKALPDELLAGALVRYPSMEDLALPPKLVRPTDFR